MPKEFIVQSFKYGVDRRREQLTSVPGSLYVGQNCHVNEGGEIVKRLAFERLSANPLPHGCFGLQETATGLVTFGSRAITGTIISRQRTSNVATLGLSFDNYGWKEGDVVTIAGVGGTGYNGTVTLIAPTTFNTISYNRGTFSDEGFTPAVAGTVTYPINLPTGVTYQQLKHAMSYIANYPMPELDAVVDSCAFNGHHFVIAHFAELDDQVGRGLLYPAATFLYDNGVIITQHAAGFVWAKGVLVAGSAAGFIADQLAGGLRSPAATTLEPFGQSSFATIRQTISTNEDTVIQTDSGTDADGVIADWTVNGTIVGTKTSMAQKTTSADNVVAVSASVIFRITTNAAGNVTITAPDSLGGTFTIANAIPAGASKNATATALVAAINASGFGYTAIVDILPAQNPKITISAPAEFGAITANLTVTDSGAALVISPASPIPFANGVTGITYPGTQLRFRFGQTATPNWYATADYQASFKVTITQDDIDYVFGAGNIGGIVPVKCMALGKRIFLLANNTFYGSALDNASLYENQDAGAIKVQVKDQTYGPTDLYGMLTYQGKLAVMARLVTQIWQVPEDPNLALQQQIMPNIGTRWPHAARSLGDRDALFLTEAGVRSLNPILEASLNAIPTGIGSPVDKLIKAAIRTTPTDVYSIVEPTFVRYMLNIAGTIYVLSKFDDSGIRAWSTYLPTYSNAGVQTTFTVAKMLVYNGLVHVLDTSGYIYRLGGSDGNTYDNCQATAELPWLNDKTPNQVKNSFGIRAVIAGSWDGYCGMDPKTGTLDHVFDYTDTGTPDSNVDSNDTGETFQFQQAGTHFKIKLVSKAQVEAATLSRLSFLYELAKSPL